VIRTNLSTRPFYNERIVNLLILLLAVLVAAATAFNVTRIIQYSRADTGLALQASRDEQQANSLRVQAARLRTSVDVKQIDLASDQAKIANELIDRRTFSWTELFNRFETTLPPDARITGVRPHIEHAGQIELTIGLVARSVDDVSKFMENLEATGAFVNVLSTDERLDEEQLTNTTITATYVPSAQPAVTPAAGGRR